VYLVDMLLKIGIIYFLVTAIVVELGEVLCLCVMQRSLCFAGMILLLKGWHSREGKFSKPLFVGLHWELRFTIFGGIEIL
jgi:hypothetical protein